MKIETAGSVWEIDETLQRYRRWPKHEKPRDDPTHGGPEAGLLEDFVWHEMSSREIVRDGWLWRLVIETPDGSAVVAPMRIGWQPPTAEGQE